LDCVKADTRQVINSHSHALNKLGETMAALDRTTTAIGEGLNLAVSCIDANLVTLDEHVNRHHCECETNKVVLDLYKAHLEELERQFDIQSIQMVRGQD